jgi:hypothetical protein
LALQVPPGPVVTLHDDPGLAALMLSIAGRSKPCLDTSYGGAFKDRSSRVVVQRIVGTDLVEDPQVPTPEPTGSAQSLQQVTPVSPFPMPQSTRSLDPDIAATFGSFVFVFERLKPRDQHAITGDLRRNLRAFAGSLWPIS